MSVQYVVALQGASVEEVVLETCFEMGWQLRDRASSYADGLRSATRFGVTYFLTDLLPPPIDVTEMNGLRIVSIAHQGDQRSLYAPPFHRNFVQISYSDHRQLRSGLLALQSKDGQGKCIGITSVLPNLGRTMTGLHLFAEMGGAGRAISFGALDPADIGAHRLLNVASNLSHIDGRPWEEQEVFPGAHLLKYGDGHAADLCDDLRGAFAFNLIDLGPSRPFHPNERRIRSRRYFEAIDAVDALLLLMEDSPKGVMQALDLLNLFQERVPTIDVHLCINRSTGKSANLDLLQSRGFSPLSIPEASKEISDVERGKGLVGERHRRSPYRDAILLICETLQRDFAEQTEIHSGDARTYRGLGRGSHKRSSRTL
ncbi:unannotated protein [freshwater metagenome]|uniref:Unannotated protein n=1 Tax=freshwater metagenome TaxID=449393 RepID=A0A6J7B6C9_9ZZZZ|nr:hypothetical protein [Actinomycetota bacterium]